MTRNGQKQAKKPPKRETFCRKSHFFCGKATKTTPPMFRQRRRKKAETTHHNQGRFKFILIQKTTPRKN